MTIEALAAPAITSAAGGVCINGRQCLPNLRDWRPCVNPLNASMRDPIMHAHRCAPTNNLHCQVYESRLKAIAVLRRTVRPTQKMFVLAS